MLHEIYQTLRGFVALFRRGAALPWTIMLPLAVMALSWPFLRTLMPTEREAFMVAFVMAMGLRLVMRADGTITSLRSKLSGRTALIVALLLGPAAMAVLVWKADPLWCQRFLSVYFGITAALYLLDVIDGRHAMVRHFLSSDRARGADAMMSRVLAVCYLVLVLLNETLIHQASLALWLVYFGLLPIFLHRLLLAVVRTVDEAYAKGYGRL